LESDLSAQAPAKMICYGLEVIGE